MFYELNDRFIVSADLDKTWAFFSDAGNLPRITPSSLAFQIATPGKIDIQEGSRIDYKIRAMGVSLRWRTLIVDWQPPRQFVDLQIKGPYLMWHHTHRFTHTPEGVECSDRVIYRIPGGPLGPILHGLAIRRQLLQIFTFRREKIREALGWTRAIEPVVRINRLS